MRVSAGTDTARDDMMRLAAPSRVPQPFAELLNLINGVQEHNAGEATSTVVSAPTFLAPAQTGLHGLQGLAQLPMAQGMHQYAVPMNDAAMFAAPLPPMQPATQMGVYAEALLHQQQQLMAQVGLAPATTTSHKRAHKVRPPAVLPFAR